MKRHTTPKLTRQQIIDRLIKASAFNLSSEYAYKHPCNEIVLGKNKPTLAKMVAVRTGLFEFIPYSDSAIVFTAKGLAKYADEIRLAAIDLLDLEYKASREYASNARQQYHKESYLRFCTRSVGYTHWAHSDTDFHFIDWRYIDSAGNLRSVNFHYQHESAIGMEFNLQDLEQRYTRCEIGAIPQTELIAY